MLVADSSCAFRRIFRRFTGWPVVTPLCGISRFALGRAGGLCVAWKEGDEIEPWLVEKKILSVVLFILILHFSLGVFRPCMGQPWQVRGGTFGGICRKG